ncbi:hypothetical protein HED60_19505 [Planctomycetales bacterium ZRK34]|nr:hypothetical protein HED60_19505 [Planctomycetales bacterium ZRK34]
MNHPDPIENLLLAQKLTTPPRRLDRRVIDTLRAYSWRMPWRLNMLFGALGTAAAASIAFAVILNTPAQAPAAAPFQIDQQYSSMTPEPVVYSDQAPPTMNVRLHHVRHTQWVDPVNNIRIEVIIPQQRVLTIALPVD